MKLKAPDTVTFTQSGFCPGCGHGVASRLVAEVAQELDIADRIVTVVDVACSSLLMECWHFDTIMAAHGRPIATAVGVKKVRPDTPVMAYIGDGAAYSIGMAETMHAAIRNDNVVVIAINNSLYGMTGGQMAPTTLPNQRTTSSPGGKDPKRYGMPFNIVNAYTNMDIAYLARGRIAGAADIVKAKAMIKKAFMKHLAGEGFCFVELLSPCPTNLNLTPVKAVSFVKDEMTKYFPTGEFIDKGGMAK